MKNIDYFAEYAQNQDRATTHLFETYKAEFYRLIAYQFPVLCRADVEDLYLQSVVDVWEQVGRGKLTPDNMRVNWGTYLIAVGKLKAKHIISRQSGEFTNVQLSDVENELADNSISDLCDSEVRENVRNLLDKLDDKCRKLLKMFYMYDYRMEQISKHLGLPNADAAKAQKYRCVGKFKEIYEKINGTSLPSDKDVALKSEMDIENELIWELKSQGMREQIVRSVRMRKVKMTVWSVSAVACIALLFVVGIGKYDRCLMLGDKALAEYELGDYRGDSDTERLNDFYYMIQSGVDLSVARDSIGAFIVQLQGRSYADDMEGYYYKATDAGLMEEAQYLDAICCMRQGRVLESIFILRAIVKGGGVYASAAAQLLDELN